MQESNIKKFKTNNEINFTGFPSKDAARLKSAVEAVLKSEKIKNYRLNFIMVSDEDIKKMNAKYRKVRRITDVISFLISPEMFIGDVYISEGRSKKQAKRYANTWLRELAYLAIHGTLHLCGYTDYDPENKTKMFAKQDKIFKCLFS
ncbi:MAG: rRNA maturation RNase YbeY [Endomicrobium sp.]|jgi:probable rRNA maturation factor|nr:rRNA maturation RNase YbeY [Endomicrobium sp.]